MRPITLRIGVGWLLLLAGLILVPLMCPQVSADSYQFTRNLTVGSTGADVSALQQILINKGFLTGLNTPTGYFGKGTQKALAAFQAANGISPASGYAGPMTRLFLNSLSSAGNATSSTSNGEVLGASTTSDNVGAGNTQPSNPGDPPEIVINPQVIVGIVCYDDVTYTNENTGYSVQGPSNLMWDTGSGVIIDSKGDVLTNRHVIIQPDQFTSITDANGNTIPVKISAQLNHCEIGQLPADTTLPTTDQIQTLNPYVQLSVFGYTAQPAFISNPYGLSNDEIGLADFAILKITGVSKSGPTFGVTSVPNSFPYATFLPIQPYANLDGLIVTYGFPGNVSQGQGNSPGTLVMEGSVGHYKSMDFGDQFYADTPLTIHTKMEVAHGRSGSPLFWRGYVIGLVTRIENLDNVTESASVASDAIAKGLRSNGLSLSLYGNSPTPVAAQSQPTFSQPVTPVLNGYQVCSSEFLNETWNGTYSSDGKYNCVCLPGYVLNSSQTGCILQPSCPLFSSYNSQSNRCQCWSGYSAVGNICESNITVCQNLHGIGATYDPGSGACTCSMGYVNVNNQCVSGYTYCPLHEPGSLYDSISNSCYCPAGTYWNGASCVFSY